MYSSDELISSQNGSAHFVAQSSGQFLNANVIQHQLILELLNRTILTA
jgi:hypothetical protein